MITIASVGKNITGAMFRLVYKDKKVMALVEGTEDTVTHTIHKVEEFETKQQALDRIKELGLEYSLPEELT